MFEVEFSVEHSGLTYNVLAWAHLLDEPEGTFLEEFEFKVSAPNGEDVTTYAQSIDELYDEITDRGARELLDIYHDLP